MNEIVEKINLFNYNYQFDSVASVRLFVCILSSVQSSVGMKLTKKD